MHETDLRVARLQGLTHVRYERGIQTGGLFTQITRHHRLTYLFSGDLICMRAKLQGRRPVLKHRQLVQRVDLSAISCAEVRKVRVAYHEK